MAFSDLLLGQELSTEFISAPVRFPSELPMVAVLIYLPVFYRCSSRWQI